MSVLTVYLILFAILLVTFLAITVGLWVGTYYFQGYIYTQPSQQLFWQAPAAALVMTMGFGIWWFAIALGQKNSPQNIPIDTLFRFTPRIDMLDRPAHKIRAIVRDQTKDKKEDDKNVYISVRDSQKLFHYEHEKTHRPWQRQDVIALEIEGADGTRIRFDPVPTGPGEYRQFVSADGWVIHEFENGPTGIPIRFSFSRLLWNLTFNFAHLFGWFVCLWVILRFQWSHALGLALVIWAVVTVAVLPMVLSYCGSLAANRLITAAS